MCVCSNIVWIPFLLTTHSLWCLPCHLWIRRLAPWTPEPGLCRAVKGGQFISERSRVMMKWLQSVRWLCPTVSFGHGGGCRSQLCVFSPQGFTHKGWVPLISIWYVHGHTYPTLHVDRYYLTHTLPHNLCTLPPERALSLRLSKAHRELAIEIWEMTLTVTLTAIWRQNTFEGFYGVRWQSLSADKLLSLSLMQHRGSHNSTCSFPSSGLMLSGI